ncbi:MAG: hypothetical protein DRN01_06530 [Thermoplasmata archaeon]|nr:MAG: hypothetical protein DRN01_06530 [Thermoplasmata archaeon]
MIKKPTVSTKKLWLLLTVSAVTLIVFRITDDFNIKWFAVTIWAASLIIFVFLHSKLLFGLKNGIIFFIVSMLTAGAFEYAGTSNLIPGCRYHYNSNIMGPLLFGKIPYGVLITWFMFLYLTTVMAILIYKKWLKNIKHYHLVIPLLSGAMMVSWDLIMDPVTTKCMKGWVWIDKGLYYGIPTFNFIGWFVISSLSSYFFVIYMKRKKGWKPNMGGGEETLYNITVVPYLFELLSECFDGLTCNLLLAVALASITMGFFIILAIYPKKLND